MKPHVDTDTIKRKRQAEREREVDRNLASGFIY
jgi:hypothetical protein